MDEHTLRKELSEISLGGIRFFEKTGSTNDIALAWAASGAPDLSLVYAEEQTSGRGRGTRRWFTPPGAALAFSLVLRPFPGEQQSIPLFSILGAQAVCETLAQLGLQPEIKWPNDVLLRRRKVCGILAESVWLGESVESIVLGVGVNIKPEAVPPGISLGFPATCLETELSMSQPKIHTPERAVLLKKILQSLLEWRELVGTDIFFKTLQERLAFRGEIVEIWSDGQLLKSGQVDGLEPDGGLRLRTRDGQVFTVQFGEMHLQPVA